LLPVMLAVIAAITRTHSSPSRNTRTPMSMNATVGLVFGCVGSGMPCVVIPCQIITAIKRIAAARTPIRNEALTSVRSRILHVGAERR
jgi:hypothetical protein